MFKKAEIDIYNLDLDDIIVTSSKEFEGDEDYSDDEIGL